MTPRGAASDRFNLFIYLFLFYSSETSTVLVFLLGSRDDSTDSSATISMAVRRFLVAPLVLVFFPALFFFFFSWFSYFPTPEKVEGGVGDLLLQYTFVWEKE